MDLLTSILLLIVTSVLYFYWSLKKAHRFFEDRGIPYLEPHWLFGNMGDVIMMKKSLGEKYAEFYNKLAPHGFGGIFTMKKPAIVIRDPDLIRHVLIKDFAFFTDRGINIVKEIDPLSNSLFSMKGDEWKNLRIKLTSTFTSGKMKMMFPLVKHCGERLSQIIDEVPDNETFDVKDLFARFTTDTIGNCAFGIETNSLNNPDSEFRIMGKKIFSYRLAAVIRTLWPTMPKTLIKMFNLTFFDKHTQEYFIDIVDKTIKYREKNNITRNDFLDLLIALKNNTTLQKFKVSSAENEDLQKFLQQTGGKCVKSDVDMTNDLLAAQAFVFFTAGFEATSIALGFAFLELSLNKSIQDRARQEILDVLSSNDGKLTYEALKQMTYVDMIIDETLRKYPSAARLPRVTNKNYAIPNTKVIIPAHTSIIISVYGLHSDEKYYDNPNEFRPERFTEEEKAKRPNFAYLPFGDGPRVCIAERFAKMQVKVGLVHALKNFSYQKSPKMKFPIEFNKSFGLLSPKDPILLQKIKL
ncbi:probable cytochrome P450 6a18 [Planococcus citri]|uniref:probable cytochrome P450 6a18 n=1 Tax=Planococcus citri TaxID=170843 RepID=UPI0031F9E85C